MSGTIINLIIQLIAGAIGGNAVGAAAKNMSIGTGRQHHCRRGRRHRRRIASDLADPDASWRGGRHGSRRLVGQLVGGGVSGAIVTRRSSA